MRGRGWGWVGIEYEYQGFLDLNWNDYLPFKLKMYAVEELYIDLMFIFPTENNSFRDQKDIYFPPKYMWMTCNRYVLNKGLTLNTNLLNIP